MKKKYPLVNGALWCTMETHFEGKKIYVMSSNSEGAHYDNRNRVYGIVIKDEKPYIYGILSSKSKSVYSQHFPLCCYGERLFFYYSHYDIVEEYKLVKC